MIKSKYINWIIAIIVAFALLFTIAFTYLPDLVPIDRSKKVSKKQYEAEIFKKNKITTVDIKMDKDKWDSMLNNAISEKYYKCDIVINNTTYKNVGIRPKGNTTLTQIASDDTTDRFSFKIEFDHYVTGQTCFGLDKLVLNNCMSDTTYMKEYLSYDLMNYMKVVSPLYSYAKISVNGDSFGLYLALEGIEESFAERNYGSGYGQLYKPESTSMGGGKQRDDDNKGDNRKQSVQGNQPPQANQEPRTQFNSNNNNSKQLSMENAPNGEVPNLQPPQGDTNKKGNNNQLKGENFGGGFGGISNGCSLVYTDDDIDSYSAIFESSVFDSDKSDYKRVIKALKNLNSGKDLEKYIDVDACLRYFAVNTVLVNLDSYFGNLQHNYYLYEKDGQLTMLPWDYNLSFAGFQSENATSAVNFTIDTPVSGTTLEDRPILGKLLEVTEYKEQYHKYLKEIVTKYFDSGRFEKTIQSINHLIKNEVSKDPTAFYTYDEYKKGVDTLTAFGLLRAKSIKGQLDGTIPSTEEGQTSDSSSLIDANSIAISDMGSQGGGFGGDKRGQGMPNFYQKDSDNNSKDDTAMNNNPQNSDTQNNSKLPPNSTNDKQLNQNNLIENKQGFSNEGENRQMPKMLKNNAKRNQPFIDKTYLIKVGICVAMLLGGILFMKRYHRKRFRAK